MKKGHDKLFVLVAKEGFITTKTYFLEVVKYELDADNTSSNYITAKDIIGTELMIIDMSECVLIIDFSKTKHDWKHIRQMFMNVDSRLLALEILDKEGAIIYKGELYSKMVLGANKSN